MFDQFKKISRLKDLTTAVGLNEQELRARGLDSLEAGRNAIQQFNSLIKKRSPSRPQNATPSPPSPREDSSCDKITPIEMPATDKWTIHLESTWDELLENNKNNYELAEKAQVLVDQLIERCRQQALHCKDFQQECSQLADTSSHLKAISAMAVDLRGKLIQLDRDIDEYCKDHEQEEFEAWKREQDRSLQHYKLDKKESYIARERQLQQKYDTHVKDLTSKRIELYEANFQAEISDYRHRRENEVSSLYTERPAVERVTQKLDNVTLDAGDTHVLDDFLGEDEESSNRAKPKRIAAAVDSEDEDDMPHDLVQADEDYISS